MRYLIGALSTNHLWKSHTDHSGSLINTATTIVWLNYEKVAHISQIKAKFMAHLEIALIYTNWHKNPNVDSCNVTA